MSRIITHLKCPKCGHEWRGYISFGHPNQDFTWNWKCDGCGTINEELIKAMPMFDFDNYEKTRSFNWADEVHIKKKDDVDAIDLSDKNTSTSTDNLEKIERALFNAFGVSQNLFNTK